MIKKVTKKIFVVKTKNYDETNLGANIFQLSKILYKRQDFDLISERKKKMTVSLFSKYENKDKSKKCIIYIPGNQGDRRNCLLIINYFLQNNINVACYDFNNISKDDKSSLSYGFYEKFDLKIVLEFLIKKFSFKEFCLWGRSMGSSVILMFYEYFIFGKKKINGGFENYLNKEISKKEKLNRGKNMERILNNDISFFFVLDSPFLNLVKVIKDYIKNIFFVSIFKNMIISKLSKNCEKEYKFKIEDIDIFKNKKIINNFLPMMILGSKDDKIVQIEEIRKVKKKFTGANNIYLEITGEHNKIRSKETLFKIQDFILKNFNLNLLEKYVERQKMSSSNIEILNSNFQFW